MANRLTRWSLAAIAVSWLAFVPVTARVFNTTLYSDDFNHDVLVPANGTTLDNGVGGSETVTWVGPALSFTLGNGTSTLNATAVSTPGVLETSGGSNPAHVKVCAKTLTNPGSGILIFLDRAGGTGYLFYRDTSKTNVYKYNSGFSQLGSDGAAASNNDVMCLDGEGSGGTTSLIASISGSTVITTSDSSSAYSTGNQGFLTQITNGGTTPTWTNFTVESVGSSPTFPAAIINAPIICCESPKSVR